MNRNEVKHKKLYDKMWNYNKNNPNMQLKLIYNELYSINNLFIMWF